MLQYILLLMSDHFQKMLEQILSCAYTRPSTFQSLFHALEFLIVFYKITIVGT